MRVLLDTNILLDVVGRREPFVAQSAAIWALCEEGKIEGYASAIASTTIFYIVRKMAGSDEAYRAIKVIHSLLRIAAVDHEILCQAAEMGWPDFEDAVQYRCAVQVSADRIITRNPRHFANSNIPVVTPAEFLVALSL